MISIFQTVLMMSATGGIAILIVMLVRLPLKKSPKIFSYLLWSIVLFRLLCPVSVTSSFSLFRIAAVPAAAKMKAPGSLEETDYAWQANKNKSETNSNALLKEEENYLSEPHKADNHKIQIKTIYWMTAAVFWLMGVFFLCGCGMYHYWKAKRMLIGAKRLQENVYEISWDVSPFAIGLLRPKICLPRGLREEERAYILLHEKTHIRRGDSAVKLLAYAAVCLHWFNPFAWCAFFLLGKDMELSCDEAVMRHTQTDIRTEYAQSLVNLAGAKRSVRIPLTFAGGGLKERIKNIMQYKKPGLCTTGIAALVIILCAVSLGSNPKEDNVSAADKNLTDTVSDDKNSVPGMSNAVSDVSERLPADSDKRSAVSEQLPGDKDIQDMSKQLPAASDTQADMPEAKELEIENTLNQWAQSFCGKDARAILAAGSSEVAESFRERELLSGTGESASFGMSSPWPLQDNDYCILNFDESSAVILYYAWTSEPHVTVWRETVTYHREEDCYQIDSESLAYFGNICTGEEFFLAYPEGISGTKMDYLVNGMGEALDRNAQLSSSNYYRGLFEPDTAAVILLNLLDNRNKVEVLTGPQKEDGSVPVQITFLEDGGVLVIDMVRQSDGKNSIWIPSDIEQYESKNTGLLPTNKQSM